MMCSHKGGDPVFLPCGITSLLSHTKVEPNFPSLHQGWPWCLARGYRRVHYTRSEARSKKPLQLHSHPLGTFLSGFTFSESSRCVVRNSCCLEYLPVGTGSRGSAELSFQGIQPPAIFFFHLRFQTLQRRDKTSPWAGLNSSSHRAREHDKQLWPYGAKVGEMYHAAVNRRLARLPCTHINKQLPHCCCWTDGRSSSSARTTWHPGSTVTIMCAREPGPWLESDSLG